jgi:nicotinamidase-related amidase
MVLAGVSTDCCVLSTALPAADAGVKVRVAADACAGATDETHRQALELMALYAPLIDVRPSNELC